MILRFAHHRIDRVAAPLVFSPEAVPRREAICVLGARPAPGGGPSRLLQERLEEAARLYAAGKAPRLFVSGRPDEVAVMAPALRALGVPEDALLLDEDSHRTLDTFVRARRDFALSSLVIVTNRFHLPRSLFLARALGLDVVGVAARAGPDPSPSRARQQAREAIARVRAVVDVALVRRMRSRRHPGA